MRCPKCNSEVEYFHFGRMEYVAGRYHGDGFFEALNESGDYDPTTLRLWCPKCEAEFGEEDLQSIG